MKTTYSKFLFLILSFVLTSSPLIGTAKTSVNYDKGVTLNLRLVEIKELTNQPLTIPQQTKLKAEVKAIQKELKTLDGGIYLSVGAVIIIVLLLILIF